MVGASKTVGEGQLSNGGKVEADKSEDTLLILVEVARGQETGLGPFLFPLFSPPDGASWRGILALESTN